MLPEHVIASAPTRIDLAGGTLDIWPLSTLVPHAMTINVAIELRAEVGVSRCDDDRVRIVSKDRGRRCTRKLPLGPDALRGPLSLLLRLVEGFEPARGLRLQSRATAPAGSGLGGSSTLAIATAAALDKFTGAGLGRPRLLRRVINLEARELGVPTGNQDYLAAIHGGLAAYLHEPDGTRRQAIRATRELEQRLVLAYTGEPRQSGFSNWEMFRRFVDGERRTVRAMESIAGIAREMRDALVEDRLDDVGRLLGQEGRLRGKLAPSVSTPSLRRADAAARSAGALGTKVCGAGGGGCIVALARSGSSDAVRQAFADCGARPLAVRIARRGLIVNTGDPD